MVQNLFIENEGMAWGLKYQEHGKLFLTFF
jgi:hypothetical protein